MGFPIQFVRHQGRQDDFAILFNFSANTALVALVGKITTVALNALGYTGVFCSALPTVTLLASTAAGLSLVASLFELAMPGRSLF